MESHEVPGSLSFSFPLSLQQHLHSILSSPPSSGPPPIPHPTICKHHQLPSHSCCHSPCSGETLLPARTIPDRGEKPVPCGGSQTSPVGKLFNGAEVGMWGWGGEDAEVNVKPSSLESEAGESGNLEYPGASNPAPHCTDSSLSLAATSPLQVIRHQKGSPGAHPSSPISKIFHQLLVRLGLGGQVLEILISIVHTAMQKRAGAALRFREIFSGKHPHPEAVGNR